MQNGQIARDKEDRSLGGVKCMSTLLNRVFRVGLIEKVRYEPSPKEVRHMDLWG